MKIHFEENLLKLTKQCELKQRSLNILEDVLENVFQVHQITIWRHSFPQNCVEIEITNYFKRRNEKCKIVYVVTRPCFIPLYQQFPTLFVWHILCLDFSIMHITCHIKSSKIFLFSFIYDVLKLPTVRCNSLLTCSLQTFINILNTARYQQKSLKGLNICLKFKLITKTRNEAKLINTREWV